MLSEALKTLAEMAQREKRLQIIHDEKVRRTFVRSGNGVEVVPFPPVPRGGRLDGFDDLVRAALDTEFAKDPEVYHYHNPSGTDRVVLVIDRKDRFEQVEISLEISDRFEALLKIADQNVLMKPRELVRFLRFELGGSVPKAILDAYSKVDFTRTNEGHVSISRGRESLGRSVEAKVQGATDLPDEFQVTLPVYTTAGFRALSTVRVEIGIEADFEAQAFILRPMPDAIAMAVAEAHAAIDAELRKALEERKVPVFRGYPRNA